MFNGLLRYPKDGLSPWLVEVYFTVMCISFLFVVTTGFLFPILEQQELFQLTIQVRLNQKEDIMYFAFSMAKHGTVHRVSVINVY